MCAIVSLLVVQATDSPFRQWCTASGFPTQLLARLPHCHARLPARKHTAPGSSKQSCRAQAVRRARAHVPTRPGDGPVSARQRHSPVAGGSRSGRGPSREWGATATRRAADKSHSQHSGRQTKAGEAGACAAGTEVNNRLSAHAMAVLQRVGATGGGGWERRPPPPQQREPVGRRPARRGGAGRRAGGRRRRVVRQRQVPGDAAGGAGNAAAGRTAVAPRRQPQARRLQSTAPDYKILKSPSSERTE